VVSRPPKKLPFEELSAYAAKLLSGRLLSEAELRDKLHRRAFDPADVPEVIAKLAEYHAVDDQRFAEFYASARKENEGFGKARVLRDLRQRRVPAKLAEQAVQQAFHGEDEPALVARFVERKFRGKDLAALFQDERQLANAYRRLRYAGFSHVPVMQVLLQFASGKRTLFDSLEGEPAIHE
jgi:regulatory protein